MRERRERRKRWRRSWTNEASRGSRELGGIVGVDDAVANEPEEALLEVLDEALLALLPEPAVELKEAVRGRGR